MDESDLDTFSRAFRRLAGVFRLRLKTEALDELLISYFRVLKHVRLDAVLAGAKVCLTKSRYFPKPAEWLDAIPRESHRPSIRADRRVMDLTEAEEYAEAQRLHYQRDPCLCRDCVRADIRDRPLRFVPTLTSAGDDEEYAIYPATQRAVVAGHWAHGEELRRWYQAREQFVALTRSLTPQIRQSLPIILREREPGEDDA